MSAYQVMIHISIFVEQELPVGFAALFDHISFCRGQLQDLRTKILLINFLYTMYFNLAFQYKRSYPAYLTEITAIQQAATYR